MDLPQETPSSEDATYDHPIHISDLFTPYAESPTNVKVDYRVEGLTKLLLFNAYTKAKTDNVADFVTNEAEKYPYTLKKEIKVPINNYKYIFLLTTSVFG